MNKHHHGFKERYAFFAWAILLATFITSGLIVLEWTENKRFGENQRRSIVEKLSTIRARLEGELNAELLLARSIITEVATNTDISKDRFSKIAEHFFKASSHIRNIGMAIRDHSDADFSHSTCPECANKLYPDLELSKS